MSWNQVIVCVAYLTVLQCDVYQTAPVGQPPTPVQLRYPCTYMNGFQIYSFSPQLPCPYNNNQIKQCNGQNQNCNNGGLQPTDFRISIPTAPKSGRTNIIIDTRNRPNGTLDGCCKSRLSGKPKINIIVEVKSIPATPAETGDDTGATPDTPAGPGDDTGATPDTPAGPADGSAATPDTPAGPGDGTAATPDTPAGPADDDAATPDTPAEPGDGGAAIPDTPAEPGDGTAATPDTPAEPGDSGAAAGSGTAAGTGDSVAAGSATAAATGDNSAASTATGAAAGSTSK